MCFMFLYLFVNFPSNYILDDYGLKKGILFGTGFTVIGCWVRVFVNEGFFYVILGQFLASIG